MKTKSKNILITGASTGIGYDLTKVFLAKGYKVYGSVRKQSDAERLRNELGDAYRPLIFDVTDHDAIDIAANSLLEEIRNEGLGGLINNAGIAVGGPLMELTIDDYRKQFEVNVFGLIKVTQAFLPLLGARSQHQQLPGKIIQISSIAGDFGMPFMSAYASSKHAVEGISESLRKELLLFGIDVVVIQPGPIKTPIWEKGISDGGEDRFKGSVYASSLEAFQNLIQNDTVKHALEPEDVAKRIVAVFEKSNPKIRYAFVPQKLKTWILPRMLPQRLVDKVIAKKIKLIK